MNSMLMYLNIAGVILIVVAIALQLPWQKWLGEKFGDNPLKARVYVTVGNKEFPVNGKFLKAENRCTKYEYKWQGKNRTVILPADYPVVYVAFTGRRKIRVIAGQLTAVPMDGTNSQTFGQPEYDTLTRSGIAVDVVNSLTGKKAVSWIMIIIIVVVAAASYFLYKNMNKPAGEQPGITPVPTANTIIIPKK
jgi:hypothetical protein